MIDLKQPWYMYMNQVPEADYDIVNKILSIITNNSRPWITPKRLSQYANPIVFFNGDSTYCLDDVRIPTKWYPQEPVTAEFLKTLYLQHLVTGDVLT